MQCVNDEDRNDDICHAIRWEVAGRHESDAFPQDEYGGCNVDNNHTEDADSDVVECCSNVFSMSVLCVSMVSRSFRRESRPTGTLFQ